MTHIYRLLVSSIAVFTLFTANAQEQPPVHFTFRQQVSFNGQPALVITAIAEKGAGILSAKKQFADDAFISTITLDSGAAKLAADTLLESGKIVTAADADAGGETIRYYNDSVVWTQPLNIAPGDSQVVKGSVAWLAKKGATFLNAEEKFSIWIKSTAGTPVIVALNTEQESSIWNIFFICLLTGLLAVLTPCVFPLIPVTVSFFLKRSKSRAEGIRNAVWYSLSIILIYTIPTLLITLVFGDKALYTLSTHPVTNLLFFAIFVLFAISFFGAFELALPNSWANKADEKAGKGGLTGIFFMALTLVIVSFSCTGPIVGTLLGQTSTGGVSLAPVLGMLGFGLGLALPFSMFAFFPTMLQSLPKSGGWLNTIKVTFGFIELALAMKFLSNVDLAYHWGLLDREIFLVIWVVIFVLLGLYLIGKLKFSHDSDLPYITVPRLFFAITSFCFALYLVPGLWGAPLKGIGGWLPHPSTQDFNLNDLKYQLDDLKTSGVGGSGAANSSAAIPPKKYTDKLEVPFGLKAYFDLDEGMAAAKALNKPVMLDFTGHSCANCRKFEAEVWSDPQVLKRMKEDFVLISLYVDEPTDLPPSEQYTNAKGEKITTLGEKNLDYEITKFGFNAQPLYMYLDTNGNVLSQVKYGYDSDIEKFIKHLDAVKVAFAGK